MKGFGEGFWKIMGIDHAGGYFIKKNTFDISGSASSKMTNMQRWRVFKLPLQNSGDVFPEILLGWSINYKLNRYVHICISETKLCFETVWDSFGASFNDAKGTFEDTTPESEGHFWIFIGYFSTS